MWKAFIAVPLLFVAASAFAQAPARKAGAPRLAAGKPGGISVSGVALDALAGKPLAHHRLSLDGLATARAEATTDAEGRFRFEAVRARADGAPAKLGVAGEDGYFTTGRDASGKEVTLALAGAGGGTLDAGTVALFLHGRADALYGVACEKGWPEGSDAGVPLLAFVRRLDAWRHDDQTWRRALTEWTPPWNALLCIEETKKEVGTYGDRGAPAFETIWHVRLFRRSDRARFVERFVAPPPQRASDLAGGSGDALPLFLKWLKEAKLQTAVVDGQLADPYTGAPSAGTRVRLGNTEGVTDSEGRFKLTVPAQWASLDYYREGKGFRSVTGLDGENVNMKAAQLEGGSASLGRLFAENGSAEATVGPACNGQRVAAVPTASVIFFGKAEDGSWRVEPARTTWLLNVAKLAAPAAQPVAVCLLAVEHKQVGQYGASGSAPALATTWHVEAVGLRDGKRLKTKVVGRPPDRGSQAYGASGDPMPALADWLQREGLRKLSSR